MDVLKAVILDWAGTTVDFGCQAPVVVLQELFAREGVELTGEEARRDMGLWKRDHIASILRGDRVAAAWASARGKPHDDSDIERMYVQFGLNQIERLAQYSHVIPGVPDAVAALRQRGLLIGSSTGYTRPMLAPIFGKAASEGYTPDASVTPDEVRAGRPAPWMIFRNLELLNAHPPRACVKVGDAPADIEEGRNAGLWTIGVLDSGNEIGLSLEQWEALIEPAKMEARACASRRLRDAGADYVVESLGQLPDLLDEIESRLNSSEIHAIEKKASLGSQ